MINSIAIDITNHCNFECIHCLRDKLSPRAHMDLDILEYVLGEISSVGIREACLTGGEVALYPRLKEAFRLIAESDTRFSLVSNGFFFEERILPLIDSDIRPCFTGACFSVDGADATSHDLIRQEGSFEKVIKAISACVKEGFPVSVKSIVHRKNMKEILDIAFLCASLGVQSLGFVMLSPTPGLISKGLMPSPEEYREVVKYIKGKIIPSFSMGISIEGYSDPDFKVPFCNPAHGLSVDHEGNLIFCCNLSHPTAGAKPDTLGREFLGNIREIGIKEGIIRHYRVLGWFMKRVIDYNLKSGASMDCTGCLQLFHKMDWIRTYESPYNRYR